MKKDESFIGLAGEFRVMSELLLRGINPAKPYLDNGTDLFLDNGDKVQVKAGRLRKTRQIRYEFPIAKNPYGKHKRKKLSENISFLILWCIDHDTFYIIPGNVARKYTSISIVKDKKRNRKTWYDQYENVWELLLRE